MKVKNDSAAVRREEKRLWREHHERVREFKQQSEQHTRKRILELWEELRVARAENELRETA